MKRKNLFLALAISVLGLSSLQSCKKESALGIDNDVVIKTPYSLYFADIDGALYLTNDGEHYQNIFPSDAFPVHLLLQADTNLLMLKKNLHISKNNGNFVPSYYDTKFFPWNSMAYYFAPHKTIYLTSKVSRGVAISKDNGETWQNDEAFAANMPPGIEPSSFAGLKSTNAMFCFSNKNNVLMRRGNPDEDWTPVTSEGFFPVDGTQFYLVSNDNTLFLVDQRGRGGVWYSEDEGAHWFRFQQGELPVKVNWNAAIATDQGRTIVVGTDSLGAYVVNNDQFVSSNGGLEIASKIYSFVKKANVYKNGNVKNYIYMANNYGMYRSENNGKDWDKLTFGIRGKAVTAVD